MRTVPQPNCAIIFRATIQRKLRVYNIVNSEISADHLHVRPTHADADRRRIVPVRQYADITMQQVKAFRVHDD